MRLGNLTQTAWRRSVGKQLNAAAKGCTGQSGHSSASHEERCFCAESGETCWAHASISGRSSRIGYYGVFKAANDLAARGIGPAGISAFLLLPEQEEEETLRRLTEGMLEAAGQMGLPLLGVQGEVSPFLTACSVFVTAVGSVASGGERDGLMTSCFQEHKLRPGEEILLCGYPALEGTLRILDEAEEELRQRFVPSFLAGAKELKKKLLLPEEILQVYPLLSGAHQIGSGGIHAALWEMGEKYGVGMETDRRAMTLRQETIEICEYFQLNPYQMASAGSCLMITSRAGEVTEVLEKAGVRASRLGVIREQNARVITSGEETQYLDRPAKDELIGWQASRES